MAAMKRNLIFVFAAIITGLISIIFGIGVVRASALFAHITAERHWLVFLLCPVGLRTDRVSDPQGVSRRAGLRHPAGDGRTGHA